MVKILIIEDEYIWQTKIEMMLSPYPQFKIIGCAENAHNALQLIGINKPDIIISDLFLGQDNVLVSLKDVFHNYPTLFLSSHKDENNFKLAVGYPISTFLVKPFHDFSLLSSLFQLIKHCKHLSEDSKYLLFRGLKRDQVKVKFANILKIEVEGNYSLCYCSDGKKYARKISLNVILKSLDERFLRISKSTVVNVSFITKIDYFDKIVYINSEAHQVGRPYFKNLRDFSNGL